MARRDEAGTVRALARLVGGVGAAGMAAGVGVWAAVRSQLSSERIVVPEGAKLSPGRAVAGPWTAYAEAEFIRRTALAATGGRTYGELEEGDAAAALAKDAALLRASLFTSVLAFGLAAAGIAAGGVLTLVGRALAIAADALEAGGS